MNRRGTVVVLLVVTAALVLGLLLTGRIRGPIVIGYVLFVTALLAALLVRRLRTSLPPAAGFDTLHRAVQSEKPADSFEAFKHRLAVAGSTQSDLYSRLRPLVRRIASALLAGRYGIDLERQPEEAARLLRGTRTWDLIRPDREPPEDHLARGWSEQELEQLIEELENL